MYLCVYCLLPYDTLQPGSWTPGLLLYIWSPSLVCKMEIKALCCYKVLVPIYQAIQCHYPQDHNISRNCSENLRCYAFIQSSPSVCIHLYLSIHIHMYQSFCVYIYIYIYIYLCPFFTICLDPVIHPPTHLSNFPSTHSPIHPLVHQFIDHVLPFELAPQDAS